MVYLRFKGALNSPIHPFKKSRHFSTQIGAVGKLLMIQISPFNNLSDYRNLERFPSPALFLIPPYNLKSVCQVGALGACRDIWLSGVLDWAIF